MAKRILLATICPPDGGQIQLALYYLKAYFLKYSRRANEVDIITLQFAGNEQLDTMVSQLNKYAPDIIGFSCYVWNISSILKIAKFIKDKSAKIRILLGGPEVSPRAYPLLKYHRFIDAVIVGEGEATFKELIEYYLNNLPGRTNISGIAYRLNNKIITTPKRPEIAVLDGIPSPYLENGVAIDLKSYPGYLPLETLRGCVYKCHYCYYHKEFQNIRYFSLFRVEKELKYLLKKSPRGIYLMDPTFNFNRERTKQVLRIFIKYNRQTKLHVELKAELLDKETVDLLHRAKADFIEIGIQSTNAKTLKLINRNFAPRAFARNILLLNSRKLPYEVQLIDGLPADSYRCLKKSIDWLLGLHSHKIKIMRFMLLPGTYLRQHARDFMIKYNRHPPYFCLQSDSFSQADLNKTANLRLAMGILYDGGLLKKSIYALVKKPGISFSTILEEWDYWLRQEHKDISRIIHLQFSEKGKLRVAIYKVAWLKLADLAVNFVVFLCKKHRVILDAQLLKSIKRDRNYFKKLNGLAGVSH